MGKHSLFISNFKHRTLYMFLLKLLVMVSMIVLILSFVLPAYSEHYDGIVYKKLTYFDSIEGPRIVLVGNSNLAFGIQSEILEEEFNIPVVNLGFQGAVDNAFHERMIAGRLHKGDIVVICHTTYADDGKIDVPLLALETIETHFGLWNLPNIGDYVSLINAIPIYLNHATKRYCGDDSDYSVYMAKSFNKQGDNVAKRKWGEQTVEWSNGVSVPQINDNCIDRLNKLNQYVNKCGATLLVAGYPIAMGEYTQNTIVYEEFEKQLRDALDCTVISDVNNYMFPYSYFWDTQYHLTTEGARIRTNCLKEDIKRWMKQNR